jgi:putative PIN family toxin of toxin-antitoxin system
MRIVVDTNVFVSACIGRGSASAVIQACLLKRVQPFIGTALLNEYRDVISRTDLFGDARLDQKQRGVLLRAFVSHCRWQRVSFRWRPNLPDDADNHVLELAIAANAAMIVTYNVKDFRRGELRFPHIEIARPETLVERLSQ